MCLFLFFKLFLTSFVFFVVQKVFLKKFEFVLIASFTIVLILPLSTPYLRIYFSTNLVSIFSLHLLLFICICSDFYLLESLLICENLFLFMIIYENLFLFTIICENLLEHLTFYKLENKQAYEHHHLRSIFYHQT